MQLCMQTRINRTRNEYLMYSFWTNIAGIMRENRLKWYVYIKRRNNDDIGKTICKW